MKLNKKYTMEEFKEMFNKAMKETIDELEKDYDKASEENNQKDNIGSFVFTMQNMLAIGKLKSNIFGDRNEKSDD